MVETHTCAHKHTIIKLHNTCRTSQARNWRLKYTYRKCLASAIDIQYLPLHLSWSISISELDGAKLILGVRFSWDGSLWQILAPLISVVQKSMFTGQQLSCLCLREHHGGCLYGENYLIVIVGFSINVFFSLRSPASLYCLVIGWAVKWAGLCNQQPIATTAMCLEIQLV